MSAAHVRRGSGARPKSRKPGRVAVPKKIAKRLSVEQAEANRLATWAFGLFVLAILVVTLVALEIPAKLGRAAGEAVGDAGFRVRSVTVQGFVRALSMVVISSCRMSGLAGSRRMRSLVTV